MIDLDWRLESNGAYITFAYRLPGGGWGRRSLGRKSQYPNERAVDRAAKALAAEMARDPALAEVGKAPTLPDWRAKFTALRADEVDEGTAQGYETTWGYLADMFGARRLDQITPA